MASFDLTNSMTSGAVYFGNYRDPTDRNSVLGRGGGGGSNIEYEEMGVIIGQLRVKNFLLLFVLLLIPLYLEISLFQN